MKVKNLQIKEIPEPIILGGNEARDISNALADVLCWFRGFKAARGDDDMPPGLETLRDLNIRLKRTWID